MALPVILCLAIIACSKPDARANAADPNTPAVVKAPPPVLPGDTIRKQPEPVVSTEEARNIVSRNYALLGAAFAFVDPKLVNAAYAPTAELTTPNGTFTGQAAILKEYQSFGMDGSVKEFTRQSAVLQIVDSTVVDSGAYTVVRKREGADSTVVRGAYASVWRIHPPPMEWVMTKDHLYPATKKKGK
ncbi:MAG: nuclear transport factor 2 family protein [Gemmatimonadales bacterium]